MTSLPPALQSVAAAVLIFLAVQPLLAVFLYAFLKIHSHIMSRVGPMYAGRFHGVGQPIAEFLKFAQKEDIIPARADAPVFRLAPLVVLVPSIMLFAVIPVWPGVVGADLDLGLFYLLAISAIGAIGVVMAAASSANKFSLVGGVRAVGQIIAYELPIVFSAAVIAMLAGSLNLTRIVEAQEGLWFMFTPFGLVAMLLFLTASFAEVLWPPFDMPIAESEIIAGVMTEYSGMRFLFFFIGEFAHILALAAAMVVMFMGGWHGPGADLVPTNLQWVVGIGWFLVKMSVLCFLFIWVRFTMPRMREDQLQRFAWKLLIPVGLANILAVGLYRVLT
ncbi:MAG TPA: complex I subunit 1 family protein [Actinomycetota bacterium]|jgi:NADH-quinone oxidoreductase subunit H|nr:complex I subunit 1 family protein [Actinomycetota bacterium]